MTRVVEMSSIFRIDSKLNKILTLFVNLVILNLLWILCCIPVFTAGAATAAMYQVEFQYLTRKDDAVVKPFFRAFRENFWQATSFWLLQLAIGSMLQAEAFYLIGSEGGLLLMILALVLIVFLALGNFYYGLIARYRTSGKQALWNGLGLTLRHPLQSVSMAFLNAFPAILLMLNPKRFFYLGLIWGLLGFSLIAFIISWIMLSVFKNYERTFETEEQDDEKTNNTNNAF